LDIVAVCVCCVCQIIIFCETIQNGSLLTAQSTAHTLICTQHMVLYKHVLICQLHDPVFDIFVVHIAVGCFVPELNIIGYFGLSGVVKKCLHPIPDGYLPMLLKACLL